MLMRTKSLFTLVLLSLAIPVSIFAVTIDDDDIDAAATARVARIKHLEGDALVKRTDGEEWEAASLNLPLVEGDEIRTLKGARVELQFDKDTYLRLDEGAVLKISSLGEEGTAVGLSEGNLLLSVFEFDPADGYLEIDAPQTTVAVTKAGRYRVEAGNESNRSVGVWVWGEGTARVYTLDSGFTLKNDQSATMSLDGSLAGKWEVSNGNGVRDAFEDWSASRDASIERSLDNAHYGKYYDSDLYGADDLNYYGSWRYNDNYGYLWSPYDNAVSIYNNWSPYRYGQWRWLPYYGWTWVNDEPWGWATYHYGRWIYLGGRWYWTPYSYSNYYSSRRSFWRPAIVYISNIGTRVCWYPLPYNYSYYDYNRRYRNRWQNRRANRRRDAEPRDRNRRDTDTVNAERGRRLRTPPMQRIPSTAVIAADGGTFGSGRGRFETAPPDISRRVLDSKPVINESPPLLPGRTAVSVARTPGIIMKPDVIGSERKSTRVGAGERKIGEPLDERLRKQKIRSQRPPLTNIPRVIPSTGTERTNRTPGILDRAPQRTGQGTTGTEVRRSPIPRIEKPVRTRPVERKDPEPSTRRTERTPPLYTPPPRTKPAERKPDPPVYTPPVRSRPPERKSPPPTYTPPPRRIEPKRNDPPPRKAPPPRTETRKSPPPAVKTPPVKSTPRQRPAPKPRVKTDPDS